MKAARVLVADDDAAVRGFLREFLETLRFEVIEATDGAQAFVMAEKEMPHLIIMDIVMPGMYGSSASRRLQEYWRTSKIPIIIVSGGSEEPVAALVKDNTHLRFLQKPLDLGALERLIGELLPKGGFRP